MKRLFSLFPRQIGRSLAVSREPYGVVQAVVALENESNKETET